MGALHLLPASLLLASLLLGALEANPTAPNSLDWELRLQDVPEIKSNSADEPDVPPINRPRNLVKRDLSEIGQKKIVCYYNYLSAGRTGKGRLTPDKVDPFMCTHLIYCTVGLSEDGKVQSLDPKLDFEENGGQGNLRKLTNLKLANPELKVLLSIDDGSLKFSKVAASEEARSNFIKSALEFVAKFNFDGIDLAWKYPNDFEGRPSDKRNYIILLRSLKTALKVKGHLLSAPVSKDKDLMEKSYDIPNMVKYLDLINLMTFDYNGNWDSYTGLHAPLYSSSRYDRNENDTMLNVKWSVDHWISQGAPREKLNLGISTWGRTYRLADPKVNGLWAPASGPALKGPYTKDDTLQGYMEICATLKVRHSVEGSARWTVVRVPDYEQPYAYRNHEWVSFEDSESVAAKTDFAKANGLGGLAIISIDTDDFSGHCHKDRFPLVKSVARELSSNPDETLGGSEMKGIEKERQPVDDGGLGGPDVPRNKPVGWQPQKNMVCYYNNMAAVRKERGKLTIDMVDPFLCTHIVYSFLGIGANDSRIRSLRPKLDQEPGQNMIGKLVKLKQVNPHLKTIVAVGGQNEESAKYSLMVAWPEKRAAFVQSVVEFLNRHQLDGLAFDWEWPGLEDKDNYVLLLKDLRRAFEAQKIKTKRELQLMATVPSIKDFIDAGFHIGQVASLLDIANLRDSSHPTPGMTKTKIHSPIYTSKHDLNPRDQRRNANWSVSYWIEKGMPREKMTLGVGIYGDSYTLADEKETGIAADSSTGPGGRYTLLAGFWGYNEICEAWKDDGLDAWKLFRYPECKCPYTFKGNTWIAYDDVESVKKKGHYVNIVPLGGAMVYSLDTDDFAGYCQDEKYPLVNAIKKKMNAPLGDKGIQSPINAGSHSHVASDTGTSTTANPSSVTKKVQTTRKTTRTTTTTTTTTTTPSSAGETEDPSISPETPSLPRNNDDETKPRCGEEGKFWFPGPNCRQYYDCTTGIPKLVSCNEGLAWKQKHLYCDYPHNEPKVECEA